MWKIVSNNHKKDPEGYRDKKTALNTAREQLTEKNTTIEEQINREMDAQ